MYTLNKKGEKYLRILRLIDKAIKDGILHVDPNNENNILVYRLAGPNTPEGWYSENVHTIARELLNNRQQFYEFCASIRRAEKE